MKHLTKAEEEVMRILWEIESGFVKEIIEQIPDPKPAYNTVSTIVRILEKKGFARHEAIGNSHKYFPKIRKEDYTKSFMSSFVGKYFDNSYKNLVSFFADNDKLSKSDIEELLAALEQSQGEEK